MDVTSADDVLFPFWMCIFLIFVLFLKLYSYLFPVNYFIITVSLIYDSSCLFCLKIDEEDFKEEQNSVACLIHKLHSDDPEEMLKVNHALKSLC